MSCSDSTPPDKSGTFYGPVTTMAAGTGRSYVTLDGAGIPTVLGVALTETALSGLPAATAEYAFEIPSQASATPFKHAVINWEPTGHAPAGVYTVPHFDVHFYTITQAQRDAILIEDPQVAAKIASRPAADYFPAGYVLGGVASRMGQHWRDPTGPEFNGQPFTKTVIYGSYDGRVTFVEPMLAKSYLETKPVNVVTALKAPAKFDAQGYQPTSYTLNWDAPTKEYRVALTELVLR
ncbi:MAG: DUF5602 domain-containing protein [Gemmatimonadaceae bacterium]